MNNEQENLSRNDEKLRGILGSLEKIDAPKDFDFQLKSKIAYTKATSRNSAFWRYFAIAVPSLACVMLVAFFALNRNAPTPIATVEQPQIKTSATPETIKLPENSNVQIAEKSPIETIKIKNMLPVAESKVVDDKVIAKTEKPQTVNFENKKVLRVKPKVKDDFVSDKTSAATNISPPIQPKGLNGTSANTRINEVDTVFEIESLLNDLGIETLAENGKLKVKSVKKNSSAERSGVKHDDVIDAVDNQKIVPKEIRKKVFEAKTIKVTREGKAIELKVQQ
jgi:hypothetical protein